MADYPDRLLSVDEVGEMLGIKPTTVYKWAYERRLPCVKLRGHALRFRLSEILKIMKQDERPALRRLDE